MLKSSSYKMSQFLLYFDHCKEVPFASFLSGGFITAIVVNPLERKLSKRTSVHLSKDWYICKIVNSLVSNFASVLFDFVLRERLLKQN